MSTQTAKILLSYPIENAIEIVIDACISYKVFKLKGGEQRMQSTKF
jgi:hypothetical protein